MHIPREILELIFFYASNKKALVQVYPFLIDTIIHSIKLRTIFDKGDNICIHINNNVYEFREVTSNRFENSLYIPLCKHEKTTIREITHSDTPFIKNRHIYNYNNAITTGSIYQLQDGNYFVNEVIRRYFKIDDSYNIGDGYIWNLHKIHFTTGEIVPLQPDRGYFIIDNGIIGYFKDNTLTTEISKITYPIIPQRFVDHYGLVINDNVVWSLVHPSYRKICNHNIATVFSMFPFKYLTILGDIYVDNSFVCNVFDLDILSFPKVL